jgi:hypothetical protein
LQGTQNPDLINPDLFGNDAGEDEIPEVLDSYFLEKPEFSPFFDSAKRLAFVRSRKGMGKSALLRQVYFRRSHLNEGEILIYIKASDLVAMQDVDSSSPATLTHGWQQRMCSRVNLELGATIRFAGADDSMTLVESAELAGFRGRNLVSALVDRIKVKAKDIEISRERVKMGDSEALLKRYSEKRELNVWLFVDDVDATFLNTETERLKASTFFSACRNLAGSVSGLNIRASVRTDVWAILKQYDEALDKCEQYMLDLKWSTEDSGRILNNKIASFYQRTRGFIPDVEPISKTIFTEPFYWGPRTVQAYRPIHILSAGRPRWATQLCRLAAKNAFQLSRRAIGMSDIKFIMKEYGQSRLSDLYKEHRHQCNKLEVVIESFAGGPARFSTRELLVRLKFNVIDRFGMPTLDGIDIEPRELGVAHFLYRIGFVNARDDSAAQGEALHFIRFEDRPHLLMGKHNLDDALPWEVHPAYRWVLRIEGGIPDERPPKDKRQRELNFKRAKLSEKKAGSPVISQGKPVLRGQAGNNKKPQPLEPQKESQEVETTAPPRRKRPRRKPKRSLDPSNGG